MAFKGYGTVLEINSVAVAGVMDVEHSGIEADDIDITSNSSPTADREFISGLRDNGEVSFDILLEDDGYASIKGQVGTATTFSLEAPDGSTWTWSGYVKSLSASLPMADACKASVTIKVSGVITFTGISG